MPEDHKNVFELEAKTGEIFEVEFSLRGILSTISLANGDPIIRAELADLDPPTIAISAASTDFLNVDIDLRGEVDDVAGFLRVVEPSIVVLGHNGTGASIELAGQFASLDATMLEIIGLIEALPPEGEKIWGRLKSRKANIGIQAGAKPHAAEFTIPAKTLEALAALGFEVVFTVYTPTKR
ncbi:hypothetical protein [Bradyrhizobium uaiense]|uniref:Uncharacterized protein n=1 Tax=Bradyrhizobium uaiense TaxID=2594946 RepID=A0A6P1BT49_9BRAD|nr:hypothetical protein [Bradyrhizobium uaiense]NEV01425.1 hypothetical protein [Bradyrhizobium uaiense]